MAPRGVHPTPPRYPTKLISAPPPLCSALAHLGAFAAVVPTAWTLFLQITLVSPPLSQRVAIRHYSALINNKEVAPLSNSILQKTPTTPWKGIDQDL